MIPDEFFDLSDELVKIVQSNRLISLPRSSSTFDTIVAHISAGNVVVSGGQKVKFRDSAGFCIPSGKDDTLIVYRGFLRHPRRPGVLAQRIINVDYPMGYDKIKLSTGTKLELPKGSYLIDKDVINEIAPALCCMAMNAIAGAM